MTDLQLVRSGTDKHVASGFYEDKADYIEVKQSLSRGYLYQPLPDGFVGRTCIGGKLRGRLYAAPTANVTVTLTPIAAKWTEAALSWSNQPTAFWTDTSTANLTTAMTAGTIVEWDILPAAVAAANGRPWWGFQITASNGSGARFRSFEAPAFAWEMALSVDDEGEQPAGLKPAGGGVVATPKPTLEYLARQLGVRDLAQHRIQVTSPAAGSPPVAPYDFTNTSPTSQASLDLAGTAYAGAPTDRDTYWRVQAKGTGSPFTAYSDWASFRYRAQGVLTITSPTAGKFGDPALRVLANITGGGGDITKFRVIVRRIFQTGQSQIGGNIAYDSDWVPGSGTTIDHQMPFRNEATGERIFYETSATPGNQYELEVRALQGNDRITVPGFPAYTSAKVRIDYDDTPSIDVPVIVAVTTNPRSGDVTIEWTQPAANTNLIARDGQTIVRVAPTDTAMTGAGNAGHYKTTLTGRLSPFRPHTYRVRAIVGGQRSAASAPFTDTFKPRGVWLIVPELDFKIVLDGEQSPASWTRTDKRTIYQTMGGRTSVDVVHALPGWAGAVEGSVEVGTHPDPAISVWDQLDALEWLREHPFTKVTQIAGSLAFPVRIRDLSPPPDTTRWTDRTLIHKVTYTFEQVGGFVD